MRNEYSSENGLVIYEYLRRVNYPGIFFREIAKPVAESGSSVGVAHFVVAPAEAIWNPRKL